MSKGKHEYWLGEEGLLLLAVWAGDGLTDAQIAEKMEISVKMLQRWKQSYHEIGEALQRSAEVADAEVEFALHKKAVGGDLAAMKFWLKNRKPGKWQDKPAAEKDGMMTGIRKLVASNEEAARAALRDGGEDDEDEEGEED